MPYRYERHERPVGAADSSILKDHLCPSLRQLIERESELGDSFSLERALQIGLVPLVWAAPDPQATLAAYAALYLQEEVQAEALVRRAAAAGLDAYVVNPSAPIGPGDRRPTPTGRLITDALAGRIPAYVDTGLNLVDVRDVAAGHLLALERGVPGRRYILGNAWGNLTLREILAMVHRAGGPPPPRRRIPHGVAIAVAAADEFVEGRLLRREPRAPLDGALLARKRMFFSPQRAVRELGLPQSDIGAAMQDAVAWFRDHGMPVKGVAA